MRKKLFDFPNFRILISKFDALCRTKIVMVALVLAAFFSPVGLSAEITGVEKFEGDCVVPQNATRLDRLNGFSLWEAESSSTPEIEIFVSKQKSNCLLKVHMSIPDTYQVDFGKSPLRLSPAFNFEGSYGRYTNSIDQHVSNYTRGCAENKSCERRNFRELKRSVFVILPFIFSNANLIDAIGMVVGTESWSATYD